ncbi:MAG: TetR/AcrR family transcriptional regulator [Sandaracinaceae bacterium]|nr:TetR/AcrR family transcriptional regulator [Sandaracinaceae bacterium]
MTTNDKSRRSRIVEVAVKLAQGRDFGEVGLREVAEQAGVALGTLYKSFSSKEEIIAAAVQYQTTRLRRQFDRTPARGATPLERVDDLFARLTRALTRRPAFARTVLGAISTNHPDISGAVLEHDGETTRMVVAALRGGPPDDVDVESYTADERTVAFLLRHIWFASMVGWSASLYTPAGVLEHVHDAARLLLAGAESLRA